MVSGLPLDQNCEHMQFSRYELVGGGGGKGTNAVHAVVLSQDRPCFNSVGPNEDSPS